MHATSEAEPERDIGPLPEETLLVDSISYLIDRHRRTPAGERLRTLVAALPNMDTRTLIVRLHTTEDPLVLWAIHLALDRRNIAPAFRWPANDMNEQSEYITWSADLLWHCRRHPGHKTRFRTWQGLFRKAPNSPEWHARAHRHFLFVYPRYSIAHWCSKGLDLSTQHRALLMTMPTNAMVADRRALEPARFAETHRLLVESAMQRPDKSGQRTSHDIAGRRAAMWRTFILACRNYTVANDYWTRITGEQLTRQAFTKQVKTAAEVVRRAALGISQ